MAQMIPFTASQGMRRILRTKKGEVRSLLGKILNPNVQDLGFGLGG